MLISKSIYCCKLPNILLRTYISGVKINNVLLKSFHITPKNICEHWSSIIARPLIFKRNYSEEPRKYLNKEEKLKLNDKINMDWILIYNAPMSTYLAFAQNFSTFSLITISAIIIPQFLQGYNLVDGPISFGTKMDLLASNTELGVFLAGFLLANIGIRWMASQYALRVYNKDKNYIAIMNGQLPRQIKKFEFIQGDISPVKASQIIPWSRFVCKGNGIILIDNYFKTQADMEAMFSKPS